MNYVLTLFHSVSFITCNFLKQMCICLYLFLQRVVSDEDGSCDELEGSQWDEVDGEDGSGDEEEEENGWLLLVAELLLQLFL